MNSGNGKLSRLIWGPVFSTGSQIFAPRPDDDEPISSSAFAPCSLAFLSKSRTPVRRPLPLASIVNGETVTNKCDHVFQSGSEDGMSRSDKRHAIRLFIYLHALGKTPALRAANYFELTAMLLKHYQELPPEDRQRARWLGKKLICTVGYRAAYNSGENMPPFDAKFTPRAKCSNCRVERLNKQKAIWETEEDVEAFCSCFPRFTPYKCPAGNGWPVSRQRRAVKLHVTKCDPAS